MKRKTLKKVFYYVLQLNVLNDIQTGLKMYKNKYFQSNLYPVIQVNKATKLKLNFKKY